MNNFTDISEDINWRKGQLLICKTLPFLHSFSDDHKFFLVKNSIPIIYSIWEGFVQCSFQTYARELNRLNLSKQELCNNIVVHTLESKFPQLRSYPLDYTKRERFITQFDDFLINSFSINNKVDTESNVGLSVLNKLLHKFNLQNIPHYPYEQDLKNLLAFRNRISHGDISLVVNGSNIDEYTTRINSFNNTIEDLMDLVLERFVDGFNHSKSYLKV